MRLSWVAMLCHVYEPRNETRLGCHAVPRVRAETRDKVGLPCCVTCKSRDMRLGWVAMLCHVYELRHDTRLGCHAVSLVRTET